MPDLAEVARALHDQPTVPLTLRAICQTAVRAVPPCEHSALSGPNGALLAASDDVARAEHERVPAPRAQALAERRTVVGPERTHVSLPLWVGESTLGVLTLSGGSFDDDEVREAEALATHAALAYARANDILRLDHVTTALQTNRRIGVAIGIVMAREGVDEEAAFEALRTVSQRSNRKLRDIAEDVIFTGELPEAVGLRQGESRAPRR